MPLQYDGGKSVAVSLEERFALLEQEVSRLRAEVESIPRNASGRSRRNSLSALIGVHEGSPAFEEVTEQIEAERERSAARRLAALDAERS